MKTWGGKAMTNRVKKECEKYVIEHLDEIKYELFTEIVQDDFRQAEAVMLYALSLHGFGRQRLQRFHEWFKNMTELPTFNGKPFTCQDCMKYILTVSTSKRMQGRTRAWGVHAISGWKA